MAIRLFPRDGKWYCWVTKRHGGQRKLSTGVDIPSRGASKADVEKAKQSAESVAVGLQERELDPDRAAQAEATLQSALGLLMRALASEVKAKKITDKTLGYYRQKSGSLLAGLAEALKRSPSASIFLHEVKPSLVDDYINLRRDLGADDSTIGKELNVWKRAMRKAKRRGWWAKDIDTVFPEFSAASNTVERWCSPEELQKLYVAIVRPRTERSAKFDLEARAAMYRRHKAGENLEALAKELGVSYPTAKRYIRPFREADSAPRIPLHGRPPVGPAVLPPPKVRPTIGAGFFSIICFSIATSAEWSALWRTRDADIADDLRLAIVRGSKNENRVDRRVPVEFYPFALLLGFAKHHGDGVERDDEGQRYLFDRRHASAFRRTLKEACKRAGIPSLSPNDLRRSHAKWLRLAGVSPAVIAPSMGHVDSRMVELRYGKASAVELAAVQRAELRNATWVSDAVGVSTGSLMGRQVANLLPSGATETTANPAFRGDFVAGAGGLEPTTCGFGIPEHVIEPLDGSKGNPGEECAEPASRAAEPTTWVANGSLTVEQRTASANPEAVAEVSCDPPGAAEAGAQELAEDGATASPFSTAVAAGAVTHAEAAAIRGAIDEAFEGPGVARASGVRLGAEAATPMRGGLAGGSRQ